MRYFLDCEYNGFRGSLLSLALVPERGPDELYLTFECREQIDPWVARNVVPYLFHVSEELKLPQSGRAEAAAIVAMFIGGDPAPEILADWPTDIELFCNLLTFAPGQMVVLPETAFRLLSLGTFSPAENSAVPHNALHDARALRDHVLGLE